MKRSHLLLAGLLLTGCSTQYGQLPAILEDPAFAAYQDKQDALEGRYLRKEMTYAQYLEEKKRLDDQYSKGVQSRQAVVENTAGRLP